MALVVVGGVAAGLSAVARARRIDPRLEIVVLEKGPVISCGACGLPYFVEGRVREARQLMGYTPEYFRRERNIEVRTGARVTSISHSRREVTLESGTRLRYEHLVIATGARCDTSGFAGAEQPHVFTLQTLDDACLQNSCGNSPCSLDPSLSQEQRRTQVTSHEFAEMVTDPAPPTGWYDQNDPNSGEVGDICNGESDTIKGRVERGEELTEATATATLVELLASFHSA